MAFTVRRELELRAPLARLWPLLSNTDRLNRAAGMPPIVYETSQKDRLVRIARARLFGFSVAWDEPPFEWVENQYYSVCRTFHGGPLLRQARVKVRVDSKGEGTTVEVLAEIEPRFRLLAGVAGFFVGRALDEFARALAALEAAVVKEDAVAYERRGGRAPADARRLEQVRRDLTGPVPPRVLERLLRHLVEAYDEEVVRMRPFELADRWGFDRVAVLRACLYAAKAGALDASWNVLCPNCRVSKAEHSTLADFRRTAHCETCNIDFDSEFDKNVEVRFTVNRSLRRATDQVFCIGGPGNTPHRRAQLSLPRGGKTPVRLDLPARRHFLRGLSGRSRVALVPDGGSGPRSLEIRWDDGEPQGPELRFAPGMVELKLENAGSALWAALEEENWGDKAATAAFVTTLQDFRDLFSSEVLAPGQEVSIRSLAVMFTDIKGSTALYERIGDATAYALVREHFKIMGDVVRERNGSIVKTIGDAIMAVFLSGEDAAEAACLIQERFREYNKSRPKGKEDIIVKLGVHRGPAIVVNTEGVLDYFGTTVNVAARVQSESLGADMVMSQPMHETARTALERHGCPAKTFDIELKGLHGNFKLWRAWLPGSEPA